MVRVPSLLKVNGRRWTSLMVPRTMESGSVTLADDLEEQIGPLLVDGHVGYLINLT